MEFIDKLYQRAKNLKKKILLPEGEEVRVLKAVEGILKHEISFPVIMGDPSKISSIAKKEGIDLKSTEIINSNKYENLDKYISLYCEIRKHKKVKEDEARKLIIQNPVFYSALAVRSGDYDGFVAGASTITRDVAKAAIYCIGPSPDTLTISSVSILVLPDKSFGSNGVFIYADTGIIPEPTAEQMADIAISSGKMASMLLDDEPRIAMLSYSTKGSGGSNETVKKVQKATQLAKEKNPNLLIDGEIQVDSAIIPEVARRKDPDSKIKGRANVFIFPDLNSGNIAYKLTERFAKARAIGPILQGLKKPASDLSRGCSSQDIVDAFSIISLLA